MTVCFVELEAFTAEVLRVGDDETVRQFESELASRPDPATSSGTPAGFARSE